MYSVSRMHIFTYYLKIIVVGSILYILHNLHNANIELEQSQRGPSLSLATRGHDTGYSEAF